MNLDFRNWKLLYDPYTDFLQVYSPSFHKVKRNHIIKNITKELKVVLDIEAGSILLIEVNPAESMFHINLDDLSREEIFSYLEKRLRGNYEKINKS